MIINNLVKKLFLKGKALFIRQNINNLNKTSLLENPVDMTLAFYFHLSMQEQKDNFKLCELIVTFPISQIYFFKLII